MSFSPPLRSFRLRPFLLFLFFVFLFFSLRRPRRTLLIRLQGRLGNQLFQIAASSHLSNLWSIRHVTYLRNSYSNETDLSTGLFSSLPHYDTPMSACFPHSITEYNEQRYNCNLPAPPSGSCILVSGFFQCASIAQAGRNKVRSIWKRSEKWGVGRKKMRDIRKEEKGQRIVVVHVRRGDYKKRFNKGLLEPLDVDYYRRAKEAVGEKGVFVVFSDDEKWVNDNLGDVFGEKMRVVRESDGQIAMIMMMHGDVWIIANSTFSWWAAFLGAGHKGLVVGPRKWFGDRVQDGGGEGIWPDGWIRV